MVPSVAQCCGVFVRVCERLRDCFGVFRCFRVFFSVSVCTVYFGVFMTVSECCGVFVCVAKYCGVFGSVSECFCVSECFGVFLTGFMSVAECFLVFLSVFECF